MVLLCGSVAPPKGKQACAGTAPVGFRQLLRPALLVGRQPQVRESVGRGGGGGRGCTGKHSFQLASGPVSLLWHGGYSMGTHPFFSPLPSSGADQALLQVPSDAAFHFPAPRVLLPSSATALFSSLPGSLCPVKWFLDLPSSFSSALPHPPQPRD